MIIKDLTGDELEISLRKNRDIDKIIEALQEIKRSV